MRNAVFSQASAAIALICEDLQAKSRHFQARSRQLPLVTSAPHVIEPIVDASVVQAELEDTLRSVLARFLTGATAAVSAASEAVEASVGDVQVTRNELVDEVVGPIPPARYIFPPGALVDDPTARLLDVVNRLAAENAALEKVMPLSRTLHSLANFFVFGFCGRGIRLKKRRGSRVLR